MLWHMRRLRWLLLPLAVLLLASGGVAAWAYTHQGYPYAVQYRQSVIMFRDPGPPTVDPPAPRAGRTAVVQQWFDAGRGNDRIIATTRDPFSMMLIRAGRYFGPVYPQGSSVRQSITLRWIVWHYEQGCGASDGVLPPVAARPVGAVTYDSFLQAGVRCARSQRLAPYTLPADFFDPPQLHQALWDRLTGWLHDHLR
jgi:hypothetical protein